VELYFGSRKESDIKEIEIKILYTHNVAKKEKSKYLLLKYHLNLYAPY